MSLAYVALVAPTEWLNLLPTVPEGQLVPLTAALGTVLTAVIQVGRTLFTRKKET